MIKYFTLGKLSQGNNPKNGEINTLYLIEYYASMNAEMSNLHQTGNSPRGEPVLLFLSHRTPIYQRNMEIEEFLLSILGAHH